MKTIIKEEALSLAYSNYCRENPQEIVVFKDFKAGYNSGIILWKSIDSAPMHVNLLIQLKDGSSEIDCWPFSPKAEYWMYIPMHLPENQ